MNIKAIVEKLLSSSDLTGDEAMYIAERILEGEIPSNQVACILTALRMKGETAEELFSFASIMREKGLRIEIEPSSIVVDVVGTGGDHANTINISTISAFIVAGDGLTVAKHGNRSVSSACGSADVLEELGVKVTLNPDQVKKCIEEVGIGFMFAPNFHPLMKHVVPIRKEMGIRTLFNLLGPLTNPASANTLLLGVYHFSFLEKMAQTLNKLGVKSAYVINSRDGLDEVTNCGITDYYRITENNLEKSFFDPQKYGFPLGDIDDLKGGSPILNAEAARAILSNELHGAKRDICVINSGFAISAAKNIPLEKGFLLAEESINSGQAKNKLNELIKMSCSV